MTERQLFQALNELGFSDIVIAYGRKGLGLVMVKNGKTYRSEPLANREALLEWAEGL